MDVKLFLEQMDINAVLVWFAVSTRIELKCFVFFLNQFFHQVYTIRKVDIHVSNAILEVFITIS